MTENYNSLLGAYGKGKKKKMMKIVNTLTLHSDGLYPKYISLYAGLSPSTVRSYLLELKKIDIVQSIAGLYSVVKKGHKDRKLPLIQNFVLSLDVPEYIKLKHKDEPEIDLKTCKMRFVVGKTNHRITAHVTATPPITLKEAVLVCLIFKHMVFRSVGFDCDLNSIKIKTSEFNWDTYGLRLDGVNCITAKTLTAVEKLYNKESSLRHEIKLLQPITSETLIGLLHQGSGYNHIFQLYTSLDQRMQGIEKQFGKNTNAIVSLRDVTKAILKKLDGVNQ